MVSPPSRPVGYNERMVRSLAFGVAIVSGAVACKSHWAAEVTQPVLLLEADTAARTSIPATIVRRDMEMFERRGRGLVYKRLLNTAYYVVVSRDRFRFHVTLRHKWEAMSDLRTWEAWVEDGRGARHEVEQVAQARLVQVGFGSVPVYRGDADFTIYARNLYDVGDRVTLVLRRPGYEYRYVWHSEAEPES